MRRLTRSATLLAFGLPLWSGVAKADARDVAGRVVGEWRNAGAHAAVLPSRFLFEEESVIVALPSDGDRACTQVAIIGARGLSFRARLSDAPTDPLQQPEPGGRASSSAGVIELRRCNPAHPVRHVVITTEAGRGTLEIVVGHSARPLPPLGSLIPERTGGALPQAPDAGALPALPPPEKRADLADGRARRDGATIQPRMTIHASADGGGEDDVDLDEGCHRIEVFGHEIARERPGRHFHLDVDAELKDGDHLLARDRTEAPDARLETCVGATTRVTLAFAGAPPQSELLVTRGTWPIPGHLPLLWGPGTRSKMARVFFLRHVAAPPEEPVFLTQGSTGTTPVPLATEPGACYVAVAGIARGHARQLQLRVLAGARESVDERGAAEEAALAAFCVRDDEPAKLEVLARGTGVSWGLAIFRVQSRVWEPGR